MLVNVVKLFFTRFMAKNGMMWRDAMSREQKSRQEFATIQYDLCQISFIRLANVANVTKLSSM